MGVPLLLSGHLSGLVGLVPIYIAGTALLLLVITFPAIKAIEDSRHIVPKTICTVLALLDFICGIWFLFVNISVIQELNQGVGGMMACSCGLSALLLLVSIRTFRRKWRASMARDMDGVD